MRKEMQDAFESVRGEVGERMRVRAREVRGRVEEDGEKGEAWRGMEKLGHLVEVGGWKVGGLKVYTLNVRERTSNCIVYQAPTTSTTHAEYLEEEYYGVWDLPHTQGLIPGSS